MTELIPLQALDSGSALDGAYAAGLERLLHGGGLGGFILVLANLAMDGRLGRRLADPLRERWAALRAESAQAENPADRQVFAQLQALGEQALQPVGWHSSGPWEVQVNPLRGLRPPRAAQAEGGRQSLWRPFDAEGFHFAKPFLAAERIDSGELLGARVDLLYNKFPFLARHALLVPQPQAGQSQWLEPQQWDYFWRLAEHLGARLPGVGLAYNALGAGASVNHLHAHLFVRQRPLPVEQGQWCHQGGETPYPLTCRAFHAPEPAWEWISAQQQADQAFNLLLRPGRLYALPRRQQPRQRQPDWAQGLAWYEASGGRVLMRAGVPSASALTQALAAYGAV